MPRRSEEEFYISLIDQAVRDCLITEKRALRLKYDASGANAEIRKQARNSVREMLWMYYDTQARPVRVTTDAASVLTGRNQDWLEDHRLFLGYDKAMRPLLYDFDAIKTHLNESLQRAIQGRRIVVVVNDEKVVGTFEGIYAFGGLTDLLDAGATVKVVTVEKLIRMRWRDKQDHARWVHAYIRALPLLIESE